MDRRCDRAGDVGIDLRCAGTRQGVRVGYSPGGGVRWVHPAGRALVTWLLCRIGRHRVYVCGRMLGRVHCVAIGLL